jgi:hypothetical protein
MKIFGIVGAVNENIAYILSKSFAKSFDKVIVLGLVIFSDVKHGFIILGCLRL